MGLLKTAIMGSFEKLKIDSSKINTVFESILKRVALTPEIYLETTKE